MQTMKIPQGTKELNIQQYADKIVIEFVPEKKKPIFTTEDGVNLYGKQDECWYVRLRDNRIGEQPFVYKEMADHVNFKYFSTRKAAEEYVAKKSWEPKDGDIISDNFPIIAIYNSTSSSGGVIYYAALIRGNLKINDNPRVGIGSTCNFKLATDYEKQLLFDKLAEQGLRWNSEEKKIEKIRWRAKHGENYWTFNQDEVYDTPDVNKNDNDRYLNGFYFQSEEQAEKARMEIIKLLLTTEF